jgi:hypothetical protein
MPLQKSSNPSKKVARPSKKVNLLQKVARPLENVTVPSKKSCIPLQKSNSPLWKKLLAPSYYSSDCSIKKCLLILFLFSNYCATKTKQKNFFFSLINENFSISKILLLVDSIFFLFSCFSLCQVKKLIIFLRKMTFESFLFFSICSSLIWVVNFSFLSESISQN